MNIVNLSDSELDRLAAERMLGWTCDDVSCHDCSFKVFHPAIDMNDAMWFTEKVGLFDGPRILKKISATEWAVCITHRYVEEEEPIASATTPARAITEACLLATEGK